MTSVIGLAALLSCVGLGIAVPVNYTVYEKDGKTACLFFQVNYDGMLNYTLNNTGKPTTYSVPVANLTRVDDSSSCDPKEFKLVLLDASNTSRLIHTFVPPAANETNYALKTLVWEYTYSYNTTTNQTVVQTVNATSDGKWSLALHDKNSSYVCGSSQSVTWTNGSAYAAATLSLSQLLVQVGNIANNTLLPGVHCAADVTTTAAPVTSTAMPSTTPVMPVYGGKYALTDKNGTLCVVLDAGIAFSVPYISTKTNKAATSYVDLPRADDKNVTVTGSCGNSTDQLVINFLSGWSFAATIDKDAFGYFAVNRMSLTYIASSQYIPDAPKTASPMIWNTTASLGWFNTTSGNYYLCNNTNTYDLGGNVTMKTIFFDLQAFATFGNSSTHIGIANECVQDTPTTVAPPTDNTVPIAVGAALAGLVLIVLIAYFIGRRRARNGYQSM